MGGTHSRASALEAEVGAAGDELQEMHGATPSTWVAGAEAPHGAGSNFVSVTPSHVPGSADMIAVTSGGRAVTFNAVTGDTVNEMDLSEFVLPLTHASCRSAIAVAGQSSLLDSSRGVAIEYPAAMDMVADEERRDAREPLGDDGGMMSAVIDGDRKVYTFEDIVVSVAITERYFAACLANGTIYVTSRRRLRRSPEGTSVDALTVRIRSTRAVGGYSVVLIGRWLFASCDSTIHRWTLCGDSGGGIGDFPRNNSPPDYSFSGGGLLNRLVAVDSQPLFIACGLGHVQIFGVDDPPVPMRFLSTPAAVMSAVLSEGGDRLAVGLASSDVMIFSHPTGDLIGTIAADSMVRGLAVCPFNDTLVVLAGRTCDVWTIPQAGGGIVAAVSTETVPADVLRAYVLPFLFQMAHNPYSDAASPSQRGAAAWASSLFADRPPQNSDLHHTADDDRWERMNTRVEVDAVAAS